MKRIITILALLLPLAAAAKPAYKITLQVDGSQDSMLLMCYYYAQGERIADTAFNNGKGTFVFEGEDELLPGMYFFTNTRNRFAEFIVYREKPFFKFHTDDRGWKQNMQVKGSKENELFFNYERASDRLYQELQEAKPTMDSAAYEEMRHRQHLRIDSLKLSIMENHPESMFAKMMRATTMVEEHVPTHRDDGTEMTMKERYNWFMLHYFDYIPLDDNFIVRTPKPVFYQHVMDYMDKYMRGMPPAEICPLLDSLIDRSKPAEEVFKWLLHTITEKFLQSNVMVYDEVYVHLVMRYFANGNAPSWYPPSTIDENVERATKWERLLVGREAPELILFDTLHRAYSLHRMKGRYTLLLFWSPTCGHCREIVPEVYKVFEEYVDSLDMTAFAILSEPDEATIKKWRTFIGDHGMTDRRWVNLSGGEANVDWREVYDIQTTPQIYLIENEKHTFIAKKLNGSLLRQICQSLM